jgi:hypothetical protein
MASPPLAAEALHVIVASPAAVETVTFDGALANARGLPVTAALAGEEPIAVSAIAVKVYVVPFVSPAMVQASGPEVHTQLALPGEELTV